MGTPAKSFSTPDDHNPRLVNYLAAGGVHGLRPMRYEKRVARNRFILLVVVLFLILLGVISVFVRNIESREPLNREFSLTPGFTRD